MLPAPVHRSQPDCIPRYSQLNSLLKIKQNAIILTNHKRYSSIVDGKCWTIAELNT